MGIGRSFQIPLPFGGMSVFENLVVAAAPKGIWGLVVERLGWQVFPLERSVVLDQRGGALAPI
jgi:ABC-type branched-subunit amino acid transport system ATPase component